MKQDCQYWDTDTCHADMCPYSIVHVANNCPIPQAAEKAQAMLKEAEHLAIQG